MVGTGRAGESESREEKELNVPSAIWTGTISFGLVSVPVKVVSATKSRDVRFNQLEEGTGARIRYRKVSEATGEEVPNERIQKGFEIGAGQYVVVDEEEMKSLAPKSSRTVEIEDFVDLDDIDPIYFEQPYYLAPDQAGGKAYKLLVEAMTELRKVAVGRVVMRSKETLVAIRPLEGALCMETMRYADEVIPVHDAVPEVDEVGQPSEKELEMARQLIMALSGGFEADKYHDEYREQMLELIERKAAGEQIVAEPQVEEPGRVLDLMAALEQSLARAGHTGSGASGGPAKRTAKRGAKTAKSTKTTKKKAARTRKSA
jgi:DNA end-binding protein Ku